MNDQYPRIKVRMYRQGLGDCFLLTIEESKDKKPAHMLIDFGVFLGTANGKDRMEWVANDIMDTTGGKLNVLAATHEHYDHLSGFNKARDVLGETADEGLKIDQLWLAWTEDEENDLAQELRKKRKKSELKIRAALKKLNLLGMHNEASQLEALAEFNGEEEPEKEDKEEKDDKKIPRRKISDALLYLRKKMEGKKDGIQYLDPKQKPRHIEGIDGVRFYVLGPPEDKKMITDSDPNKGQAYEAEKKEKHINQADGKTTDKAPTNDEVKEEILEVVKEDIKVDDKDFPFSRNYKISANSGEIYLLRNRIIALLSKNSFEGLDNLLQKLLVEKFAEEIEELLEMEEDVRDQRKVEYFLKGNFLFNETIKESQEDPWNCSIEKRMQNSLFEILKIIFPKENNSSNNLGLNEIGEEDTANDETLDEVSELKRKALFSQDNNQFSLDFNLLLVNVFVLRYGDIWESSVTRWVKEKIKILIRDQTKLLIHHQLRSSLSRHRDKEGIKKIFVLAKKAIKSDFRFSDIITNTNTR